jgi:SUKH-3 immunity protein of toxin-antitoxin system
MRLFDAARDAYVEFYRVAPRRNGPGVAQRIREFSIGGGSIMHLADPLHEFGEILGAEVFPLGVEGADEAVLVIDDRGRVFALDQGGEWFIADTMHEALVALLMGRPAARVRNDGTWDDR